MGSILLAHPSVDASQARLLVMGTGDAGFIQDTTGNSGSFYVEDIYNIFYNPSYINDSQNWAIIEKSTNYTSNAQGGFVTKVSDMNMGLYFNRIAGSRSILNTTSTTNPNGQAMRPLDFTLGKKFGDVKTGVGVTYGSYKSASGQDNDLDLRLGLQWDRFEPFLSHKVVGLERSEGSNVKLAQHIIGTRYRFSDGLAYASWRMDKRDNRRSFNAVGFGFSRSQGIAKATKANYAFGAWRNFNSAQLRIPFDFSVESDVNDWLALRGGFSFRLWDRTGKVSQTDFTTGRIGASFKHKKVSTDFAVGTGSTGGGSLDNATFGFDDSFFTAASIAYNW